MTVDVACIGAHPDDVEIGMGGTVALMSAEGLRVAIVDLTDGEPTPAGTRETRLREASEAANVLGVAERRTLAQPNRYLLDKVEARTELAEVLRELRPRLLFVPFPVDAHPDHVAASRIADAARFYAKFTKTEMAGEPHYPARAFRYMAVHMRLVERPAFVVDMSAHAESKKRALECYVSQFSGNPNNAHVVDSVMQGARAWGAMIGTEAGEPFFSEEPVGVSTPSHVL